MDCIWSATKAVTLAASVKRCRLLANCRGDAEPKPHDHPKSTSENSLSRSRPAVRLQRLKRRPHRGATCTFVAAFMLAAARAASGQGIVPGETDAIRIEDIYYEQGPQQALDALAQDYRRALGGPAPQAGRQQIDNEISRLEAHTTRYSKYSPLVAIATQWCVRRHEAGDFPLHYAELLPTGDASPDALVPDVELDREMVQVLQNNWRNYANLTRSQTRGYVVDERQITMEFDNLMKDQSDQEDVRVAVKNLTSKQRAARP